MNEKTTDPRDALMRALSIAEHFVAATPVVPSSLDLSGGSVRGYMHEQPEAVTEVAGAFGLALSLRTDHGGVGRPYVQATGIVHDVEVSVWALGHTDEQERYAACVPVDEEPAPLVSDDTIRQAENLMALNIADREAREAEAGAADLDEESAPGVAALPAAWSGAVGAGRLRVGLLLETRPSGSA